MAALSALKAGLAARLATITGLTAYSREPGSINGPAAVVELEEIAYDSTMSRGSDDYVLLVRLFVPMAENDVAQSTLDSYLDSSNSKSVKAVVEAEATLGGVADYARVSSVRDYRIREFAGVPCVGVEILVEVCASGS